MSKVAARAVIFFRWELKELRFFDSDICHQSRVWTISRVVTFVGEIGRMHVFMCFDIHAPLVAGGVSVLPWAPYSYVVVCDHFMVSDFRFFPAAAIAVLGSVFFWASILFSTKIWLRLTLVCFVDYSFWGGFKVQFFMSRIDTHLECVVVVCTMVFMFLFLIRYRCRCYACFLFAVWFFGAFKFV